VLGRGLGIAEPDWVSGYALDKDASLLILAWSKPEQRAAEPWTRLNGDGTSLVAP
jgi:hypothetical protein